MSIKKPKRFPFGIHVKGKHNLTSNLPIEILPTPESVSISMSQHIGAPATPTVNVGDTVVKGQLIGSANGPVSANVYASICGTVTEIKDFVNGLGQKQTHVTIKNDGNDQELLFEPLTDFSAKAMIERVRLAGIVGLGGAGFPTDIKLSPKTPVDVLVVNGAECEPYLTCDNRLMIERSDEIYKGIKYVQKILGVEKVVVGIEKNKPQAIEVFSKFDDLTVVPLKKQYPMGSEKHLIYCTTGRKVPIGKMPFDVGCCVQNIKTLIACYQAIELNKPLTQTVLTVSGHGIVNPKNISAPLGTSFNTLIEYCGGTKDGVVKAVAGGPMMGKAIYKTEHFTRKTDSGLLLLLDGETDLSKPSNCINCARCAMNCPMRLMPMYIESFALAKDYASAQKYGAMNCIECGSCAYNCPAKRPLVQSISNAKIKIREMNANGK